MARDFTRQVEGVVLRNSTSAITASTQDSSKNNARIINLRSGFALLVIHAVDVSSGDETYTVGVDGRDTVGSGSYTSLGSIAFAAAAATVGAFIFPLDTIKKELRANATLGGTTPSLTYSLVVFGQMDSYAASGTQTLINS